MSSCSSETPRSNCVTSFPEATFQMRSTASKHAVLRIWNVASGKLVTQFDRGVSDEQLLISFCYAPDGATLASAARGGIALLDCATWQVKRTVELPEPERAKLTAISLTYSPDGQWLAAALNRRLFRFWNTAIWETFTLPLDSEGRIALSPDSKTLAVCRSGGGIELWDLATRMKTDGWLESLDRPDGN